MAKTLTDYPTRRDKDTGCLLFLGYVASNGYGRIGRNYAHRLAYEAVYGSVPAGLEIDHVYERGCRHKNCIEPTHLEAVTHVVNMQRRVSWGGRAQPRRTHCKHGHPMTDANLGVRHRPNRVEHFCKTCKALRKQESLERLRHSRAA